MRQSSSSFGPAPPFAQLSEGSRAPALRMTMPSDDKVYPILPPPHEYRATIGSEESAQAAARRRNARISAPSMTTPLAYGGPASVSPGGFTFHDYDVITTKSPVVARKSLGPGEEPWHRIFTPEAAVSPAALLSFESQQAAAADYAKIFPSSPTAALAAASAFAATAGGGAVSSAAAAADGASSALGSANGGSIRPAGGAAASPASAGASSAGPQGEGSCSDGLAAGDGVGSLRVMVVDDLVMNQKVRSSPPPAAALNEACVLRYSELIVLCSSSLCLASLSMMPACAAWVLSGILPGGCVAHQAVRRGGCQGGRQRPAGC